MRSTGIVRRLDELGRIVIPKELRRSMKLEEGAALEIFTEGSKIILGKYQPGCMCCGDLGELVYTSKGRICKGCLAEFIKEKGKS